MIRGALWGSPAHLSRCPQVSKDDTFQPAAAGCHINAVFSKA